MNSMDAHGGALSDGYSSIIDAECDSLCKELEGKHCACSNKVDMPRLWQTLSKTLNQFLQCSVFFNNRVFFALLLADFDFFEAATANSCSKNVMTGCYFAVRHYDSL